MGWQTSLDASLSGMSPLRERESQDTDVPLLLLRLFLAGKLLLLELAKNGMPMCVLRAAFARTRL